MSMRLIVETTDDKISSYHFLITIFDHLKVQYFSHISFAQLYLHSFTSNLFLSSSMKLQKIMLN